MTSRALEKYRALRDYLDAGLKSGGIVAGSFQEDAVLDEMDEWWRELTTEEIKLLNAEEPIEEDGGRDICERCNRPEATQADYDDPNHPEGCDCEHCASLCWGDNCEPFDWKRQVAELEKELAVARAANERDRSVVAEAVTRIGNILRGYGWLAESRGSYACDDEKYQEEFGRALDALNAERDKLVEVAKDWKHCPTTQLEIQEARQAPENLWRRIKELEAECARLRAGRGSWCPSCKGHLLGGDHFEGRACGTCHGETINLVDALAPSRELRSVSEHCTRTHEQYCHICDNAECGDNTNPTVVALWDQLAAAQKENEQWMKNCNAALAECDQLKRDTGNADYWKTRFEHLQFRADDAGRVERVARLMQQHFGIETWGELSDASRNSWGHLATDILAVADGREP